MRQLLSIEHLHQWLLLPARQGLPPEESVGKFQGQIAKYASAKDDQNGIAQSSTLESSDLAIGIRRIVITMPDLLTQIRLRRSLHKG